MHKPRIYEKTFPDSESVPKPAKLTAHRAQVSARQLQELVKLSATMCSPNAVSDAMTQKVESHVTTAEL